MKVSRSDEQTRCEECTHWERATVRVVIGRNGLERRRVVVHLCDRHSEMLAIYLRSNSQP